MNCSCCKKPFDPSELRRPSLVLRILYSPILLVLMLNSARIGDEALARYCPPCRRQMNTAFFFIVIMVVASFGALYNVQKMGL
jgi:hypothetical protein